MELFRMTTCEDVRKAMAKAFPKPEKEWERLRYRIMSNSHNAESIIQLRKDVDAFLKSEASSEDKKKLLRYTESLAILADAVDRGLMK